MVVEFTRNDIMLQFERHYQLAEKLRNRKNYRYAIEEYFQALPFTKYLNHITPGQLKQKIADCYYFLHEYKLAITYFNEIIDTYLDELTENDYTFVLIKKGVALKKLGNYRQAIELFTYIAQLDLKEAKIKALYNLGILYAHLHRFTERDCLEEALDCLKKALVLTDEGFTISKHYILYNIGVICYELGKYEKSLEIFENALTLTTDPICQAKTYCEIARTKIELYDFQAALQHISKAQKILFKHKDYHQISNSLCVLGLLYLKKGQITNSHNCLETALFGYLEIHAYPEVVLTCWQLYKLLVGTDPSRAEVYYEQYKFYINYVDPLGEELN